MKDIGKIVKHGRYGYGVTWRQDKFGRLSVKFTNGKEVGAFANQDLDFMDKKEIEDQDVVRVLGNAGLADYIKMEECVDFVTDYKEVNKLVNDKLMESLDLIYNEYKLGSGRRRLKSIILDKLRECNLSEEKIEEQADILKNLTTSYQVVKYVSSSLAEDKMKEQKEKSPKSSKKYSLKELDFRLNSIISSLKLDGKEGVTA